MTERADVVIIGAGPVGLALAIELGMRGVRATLVEENDRIAPQPRAKTTNVRSMEHMRRWGIAAALRASAPLPADYPTDVIFTTRLFGHRLARFENAFNGYRVRDERYSEPAQWVPQFKVEAALRRRALSLPGVTLHAATRFLSLVETPAGVSAEVEDIASGARRQIAASYLVGADGARSQVRRVLDIAMQGRHAFGFNLNYVIRVPGLRQFGALDPAIMYWLVNQDSPAATGPMDQDDVWFYGFLRGKDEPPPDDAAVKARIRRSFGRDVDVEILVTDAWAAHSLIAERYGTARVHLAGDACHLHPPFGGYGMNLGLGDSVDLGWKLAAMVQGWGGAALLDSYAAERRPVHRRVIDEAVANYALLSDHLARPEIEQDGAAGAAVRRALGDAILTGKAREFHTLGVVLGAQYSGSPIVVPDGSAAPPEHTSDYVPSAHPGCLAPHLWLADGSSLYDGFGLGFTLLATPAATAASVAALAGAAQAAGLPLTVLRPEDGRIAALYQAALTLIRPDQHVAWRGDAAGADAAGIIARVRGAAP